MRSPLLRTLPALTLATLCTLPAAASGPGENKSASGDVTYVGAARMTYKIYEASVPHVDLGSRPIQFDQDSVFCRMNLAAEMANIFVFRIEGDQPLLAIKSYALDDDFLPF